jgi:oxygen-independent coproporphyrinogen-3 oxidase
MGAKHISAYILKIEEGTPFYARKSSLPLPDEDETCDLYLYAVDELKKAGYNQYEISNFSHEGYESRHNLKYWRREDYLGLGLAAHSCWGAVRFSNTECLADYLEGRREATRETVSEHDILCERIMLGMRLDEGVDFERLGEKAAPYRDALLRYVDRGLVKKSGSRLSFTDDGMYVSNAILADVLDFEE